MSKVAVLKIPNRGSEESGGDKARALDAALAQIDRAFGKGSVMKLGKGGVVAEIESVSTGSLGSTWRSASAACPAGG
jgi:recombination protein RecA